MTRPDDSQGPTIWAAREVRRDVPSEWQVLSAVALIIVGVLIVIGALIRWALS